MPQPSMDLGIPKKEKALLFTTFLKFSEEFAIFFAITILGRNF